MAAYRPKKWKRQRRQKGQDKAKARQRYRQNRSKNRMKAKKRYKQVRKNPAFKRRKKLYKRNPSTRKRLATCAGEGIEFLRQLPGGGLESGCIIEIDPWNMELTLDTESGGCTVDVEAFLSSATLYDEADVDRFFDMLDCEHEDTTFYLEEGEDAEGMSHLAFNKENPSDLFSQVVKVLGKAEGSAEGNGKKGLQDASSRVKGLAKLVADAWLSRKIATQQHEEDSEMTKLPTTKLATRYLNDVAPLDIRKAALEKAADRQMLQRLQRKVKDLDLVVENKVRIYVEKGAVGGLFILEVPTKPLRSKKMRIAYAGVDNPQRGMSPFVPRNIQTHAKFSKSDDFDTAVRKLQRSLKEAEKLVEKGSPDQDLSPWFPRLTQSEVHYLEVPPQDAKDFEAKGKNFTVHMSWGMWSYTQYDDSNGAQSHDPSYSRYRSSSPVSARKLFKMLKAKPDALKSVPSSQFSDWLDKNKIKYRLENSVWH